MSGDPPRLFELPPGGRRRGRNRRALDATVAALRGTGRLEPVDAALAALGRAVADSLDRIEADPDRSEFTVASLARVHLQVIAALVNRPELGDDSLDELAAALAAGAVTPGP